jgi:hypothetical protein
MLALWAPITLTIREIQDEREGTVAGWFKGVLMRLALITYGCYPCSHELTLVTRLGTVWSLDLYIR